MTYEEATAYIFEQHPAFERTGAEGYKPGLGNILALSRAFGNPHLQLKCIHIAGTNGKGTTAHTIAAALQNSGYKTGLYTSPHIHDFRERILVDGRMISKQEVIGFVERYQSLVGFGIEASFFEIATVMAFEHFRRCDVDVAVIETGLGGRLDSTNIVSPDLCVITNISFDHTDLLGDTLVEIAGEKAGIIKPGVPVVIGEADGDVRDVFIRKAASVGAPVYFAQDMPGIGICSRIDDSVSVRESPFGQFKTALCGTFQENNTRTTICALHRLREIGYALLDSAVSQAFTDVCRTLHCRWQRVGDVLCDCGHNPAAWIHIAKYISDNCRKGVAVILGFCADKDVDTIISMLPPQAEYYCVAAHTPRAIPADRLCADLRLRGLSAEAFASLDSALAAARASQAGEIFLGGSFYILSEFNNNNIRL